MPINHEELIDEIESHIRRFGGGFGEWCVGTAKDSRGPFFRRHLAADLGDGLAYREAFTTTAAQTVVDHLVNNRGLARVPEAERRSALQPAAEPSPGQQIPTVQTEPNLAPPEAVSVPGRLVFVYRKITPAHPALRGEHGTLSKLEV
jgi:hypothetical protein